MTPFLEWLLDLQHIRIGEHAPLRIEFTRAWPGWLTTACILIGLLWIVLVYRRESANRIRKTVVGSLRLMLLVLLLTLMMGPTLVLQKNRIERSVLAVLLDNSASMGFLDRHDPADESDPKNPISRLDLATKAMLGGNAGALNTAVQSNDLFAWTFNSHLDRAAVAKSSDEVDDIAQLIQSASPSATQTDLGIALSESIQRSEGRRLAGIVLVTDGRSTDESHLSNSLAMAADRRVPIHCVRVGSPSPPPDIIVSAVRAPRRVLERDLITVAATVRFAAAESPRPLDIQLIDDTTDTVLASKTIDASDEPQEIQLHTKPERIGHHRFRVEANSVQGELSYENNAERVSVNVIDDNLRVLFVDGYPRYEYRYLKNALVREDSLDVSVLLVEADEDFVQEGTTPIRRFPQSPEELNRYDVVLFGDVDPRGGWLSTAQMNMLLDSVSNNAQGFAMLAGERSTPSQYAATPLARLIPVRMDLANQKQTATNVAINPLLTPEGESSSILRFFEDEDKNREVFASLPPLFWVAPTLGVKPGATTLLEHPTQTLSNREKLPILVSGRYGKGNVLFLATDDTWRWRRHTGELLHDAFWVQLVRAVANPDRNQQSTPLRLSTPSKVLAYGQPIRVTAELLDPQLVEGFENGIPLELSTVLAEQLEPSTSAAPNSTDDRAVVSIQLAQPVTSGSKIFEASFNPPTEGHYSVTVPESQIKFKNASTRVEPLMIRVDGPDLERKIPQADVEALDRIAKTTGGRVVGPDQFAALLAEIPDRTIQIPDDIVEPLWDTKLALLLFVGLAATEWTLRKLFGMA